MKKNAIGYVSSVVIVVASTAWATSAALGFVVPEVGFQAPAIMIVSFLPMLFIAMAYLYMNRADPGLRDNVRLGHQRDGSLVGWIAGWAIVVADIIVMANLRRLRVSTPTCCSSTTSPSFRDWFAGNWIAIMTTITTIGIELSARTQRFLLGAELITLALFAVVALVKVYGGDALAGSAEPELSWFSPFGIDGGSGALVAGVLIGVFIYWGWDSLVINEETEDSENVLGGRRSCPRSSWWASTCSSRWRPPRRREFLAKNADAEDVLRLGTSGLRRGPMDKLVIIAVLTSAAASTQTTILPTVHDAHKMAVEKVAGLSAVPAP